MIELQLQHLLAVEQPQPGGIGIGIDVARGRIPLGDAGAHGTGQGNQQQKHDGQPQIAEPGGQAFQS